MAGKRGRPKKTQDPDLEETPGGGSNYRGIAKRDVQYSLASRIRERTDPDLICQFFEMIVEGKNPVWVRHQKTGVIYKVDSDPNPLQPSPTLEQRASAVKELVNRGWGLPVQSLQIDAQLKMQIQDEIPQHLVESGANWKALDIIRKALRLEDGNTVDAEFVDVPTVQEPCQVETPTNSNESDSTQ